MSARYSTGPGAVATSDDYVAAWNAVLATQPTAPAGYGDYSIPDWNGGQSNANFGGANTNLAIHDQVIFTVDPSQAGLWQFRLGIDFGLGGTLQLDG